MEYRKLGRDGPEVSVIGLGTMTFGQQNTEAEAHEQMDYALAEGINLFDAAEIYPIPPKAETQGLTERFIGTWLKSRKTRDRIVLATKAAGRGPMTWLRDGGGGTDHSPAQIAEAIDKSLVRLQTDYIDLYQLHWPDRPVAMFGADGPAYVHREASGHPVEDILGALARAVEAGKIRHVGLSNETPWGAMAFLRASGMHGLPRIRSIQNAYSLVNRSFEMGLAEIAMREGVGLLAYSPLAQGYLTGKYRGGALPPGSRKQLFNRLQRYETPEAQRMIPRYLDLASRYGLDPAQLAIRFCTARPFVASVLIGATTMEQLRSDIAAKDVSLPPELLKDIDALHREQPNPSL